MFAIYGDFIHAPAPGELVCREDTWLVVDDGGRVEGVYSALPAHLAAIEKRAYPGHLILPGFADLHIHSVQYAHQGLGYDLPFGDWLSGYAYHAEELCRDDDYARGLNHRFVRDLWRHGVTRSVIMAPLHAPATLDLIERLKRSGLGALVGKMNSDYGSFGEPLESTADSIQDTMMLLEQCEGPGRVGYIMAPEFIPCCSDELMRWMGEEARVRHIPVHSHIAEGDEDCAMVEQRYPGLGGYAAAYRQFGLFGQTKTAMAHCLFCTEDEFALMAREGVWAVHCPLANLNAPSRLLPVRHLLELGVPVALGSDIGGGFTLNMTRNMVAAVQTSRLVALDKPADRPLTVADAFYLGTRGGAAFFGDVGCFEPGMEFDAIVVDDQDDYRPDAMAARLERFVYTGDLGRIRERYCCGERLEEPC